MARVYSFRNICCFVAAIVPVGALYRYVRKYAPAVLRAPGNPGQSQRIAADRSGSQRIAADRSGSQRIAADRSVPKIAIDNVFYLTQNYRPGMDWSSV
jgi:hypothetical protein